MTMVIFQPELLQHFYGQDVELQLCKPLANAHPGTMREDDGGEGMSRVVLGTAS